eukprot:COSAG03_NODE_7872_length_864_cov_2.656619_1_plen_188_part_10
MAEGCSIDARIVMTYSCPLSSAVTFVSKRSSAPRALTLSLSMSVSLCLPPVSPTASNCSARRPSCSVAWTGRQHQRRSQRGRKTETDTRAGTRTEGGRERLALPAPSSALSSAETLVGLRVRLQQNCKRRRWASGQPPPDTESETDRPANRQTGSQAARQPGSQTGRQAARQADRQTGRQTDRQTDRQ